MWHLYAYRRLCRVDAISRREGVRIPRFDYFAGSEADLRAIFAELRDHPQVLAAELRNDRATVVDRFDRLMDLLPDVEPAAARLAILEPALAGDASGDSARSEPEAP